MSFCMKCGTENAQEWIGFYSSETGEKLYRDICPNACAHGDHKWECVKTRLWQRFFLGCRERCKLCHVERWYWTPD